MDNATNKTRVELLSEAAEALFAAELRAAAAVDDFDSRPATTTQNELDAANAALRAAERRLLDVARGEGWLPHCCACGDFLEAPGAPGGVPLVRLEGDAADYCPECAAFMREQSTGAA